VDFPFILGADGTKALKPREDRFDARFFAFALQSLNLASRGYNRHYTLLKERNLPRPELPEQRKIAGVLGLVQRAMEQHERLLALTAELKRAFLHQLFTDELEDAPELSIPETLLKFRIERNRQLPSALIKEKGRWPVIDQGQAFVSGFTDDESKLIREGLPLVIFGDHTRCVKFVDFPFVLGADGTKALKVDEKKLRPKFFYYALAALEIPSRGYNRHFTLLKEKRIKRPDFPVQDAAIDRFIAIDRKISINQRKHAALSALFQTLLHELMTERIRVNDLELPDLVPTIKH
jgi:type I restriction enzyme S subunit